jgi:hypothetical protein
MFMYMIFSCLTYDFIKYVKAAMYCVSRAAYFWLYDFRSLPFTLPMNRAGPPQFLFRLIVCVHHDDFEP